MYYDATDGRQKNVVDQYRTPASQYFTPNPTVTAQQMCEYALLTLYGDAINLHIAPVGSTSFVPLIKNGATSVAPRPWP